MTEQWDSKAVYEAACRSLRLVNRLTEIADNWIENEYDGDVNAADAIKMARELTSAVNVLVKLNSEMSAHLEHEAQQREVDWASYLTTEQLHTVMEWVMSAKSDT